MSDRVDIFDKCYAWDEAKRVKAAGMYPYFQPIEGTTGHNVVSQGKRRVMIGSNNYLGLTHHPKVIEAAKNAVNRYGTGCTGSRFLNGNLKAHEDLEERLAKFVGKESALVFNSGFLSNQGTISCLVNRRDVLYCDRENHASIIEATRVAMGTTIKFKHNDMRDLERVLKTTREKYQGAVIVADGVFSMSGDIINFPKIVELAAKYDCRVYIDDAHSIGVLGPRGEGTAAHFGQPEEADIIMGTFSKSFASIGGFVAGEEDVISYIKHKSRPFIFSAAMPPAAVGTVLECLRIVETEPEHLANLWENVKYMRKELALLGYNTLNSQTPIIPLLVGDYHGAFKFTRQLYDHGVFATPVIAPAVPEGCELIRTSYMATHTRDELDYALEVLEVLGKEFGILGNDETQEKLAAIATQHFGERAAVPAAI